MTSSQRFKSSEPYSAIFDRTQSNRDFMVEINANETKHARRTQKMDKSPSLKAQLISNKKG